MEEFTVELLDVIECVSQGAVPFLHGGKILGLLFGREGDGEVGQVPIESDEDYQRGEGHVLRFQGDLTDGQCH